MKKLVSAWLPGILFLFLLQLLSDFFESIYAFGLLVTRFTPEVAAVLLIFAPLGLLFVRSELKRPALIGLGLLALACRVVEPFLPLGGRLVFSGLGTAALLLFFPAWLAGRSSVSGDSAARGLSLGLALSILLRALGSGAESPYSGPAALILAFAAGWSLFRADLDPRPRADSAAKASFARLAGLALGIAAVFLMLYFAFASPAVIARWTGFSYPAIVTVLVVTLVLFNALMDSPAFVRRLTRTAVLAWNALFVLALALTILPHQVRFPLDPGAYPFDAPAVPAWAALPLLVVLLLAPVILVDLALLTRAVAAERPKTPQLGGAFGLASLFFLVMVFFHVFTTVYDYAPVIGPLFRDRFWFVYLLAGLGLALPVLLVRREGYELPAKPAGRAWMAGLGLLAAGSILAVAFTSARPSQATASDRLAVMTYNIQQGFDSDGRVDLDGQLGVIRRTAPDILGLQESDTARIADGNVDAVRYFADKLNMYSYYGPTSTIGTFGIALLSKYPIDGARTFYLYSTGEQTAAIQARITVKGRTYHVFVTHLGNGGPPVQLQDLLTRVVAISPVIVMGDFNFAPDSEQYRSITAPLADSWLLRWPDGRHIPGADLPERIDYIFVTPGIEVLESEYMPGPDSDHPALFTKIRP